MCVLGILYRDWAECCSYLLENICFYACHEKLLWGGWRKSIALKWTWVESLTEQNWSELNPLSPSSPVCCSGGLAAKGGDPGLRGPRDRGDPAVWDSPASWQPDHLTLEGKEKGIECLSVIQRNLFFMGNLHMRYTSTLITGTQRVKTLIECLLWLCQVWENISLNWAWRLHIFNETAAL